MNTKKARELARRLIEGYLLISGIVANIFLCMFLVLVMVVSTGEISARPLPTIAATEVSKPIIVEKTKTPRPTRTVRPTETPAEDVCYLEAEASDGVYSANVYVVAKGRNARAFCDYMVAEASNEDVRIFEVDDVPNFQTWCKKTYDGMTIEVVAEYGVFGLVACDGLDSPTSLGRN